jgi:hypothetical protein
MKGKAHLWPAIIASLILLIALAPLPYIYYQLLRWIVCGIAIFMVSRAYGGKRWWAIITFGIIAILFNPIFIIFSEKGIWQVIDVLCAIAFIVSIPLELCRSQ